MISQTAEYALRAIITMARNPEAAQVTQQIADAAHIPAGYLSKVLQSLGRAGLVSSHRGLGGGFTLTKKPAEMTVYEIVQAVDPLQRVRTCPLKLEEHAHKLCPLHQRLDEAMAQVEKSFRETTVAELLPMPGQTCACEHTPSPKTSRK